ALEAEQRAFVDGLSASDLPRLIAYTNNQGIHAEVALAPLLQHVVNHGTHHRSEIATMLTIASGSPPDTGIATYRATVVKRQAMDMKALADDHDARHRRALAQGGAEAGAKQHA